MLISDLKKVFDKFRSIDIEEMLAEDCYDYFEDDGQFVLVLPLNMAFSIGELTRAIRSKFIKDIRVFPNFIDGDVVFDYFVELTGPIEDLDMDDGLCDDCRKKHTAVLN